MEKVTIAETLARCGRPHVIAWAVCLAPDGRRSICPLGWHMMTSRSPFMMAVAIHPERYTHSLISAAGEFVLAYPGEDLAEMTLEVGTHSGRDYDKFERHNLTLVEGEFCKTPLIRECIVNLECRVDGTLTTGDHTIFAGEVKARWMNRDDRRPLCSVDDSSGIDQLVKSKRYQFGVVKR